MNEFLKVENNNDLVRDVSSNAIINVNKTAYDNYMKSVNQRKNDKQDLRDAVREINVLKNEMKEIKQLLLNLTDKK